MFILFKIQFLIFLAHEIYIFLNQLITKIYLKKLENFSKLNFFPFSIKPFDFFNSYLLKYCI